MSPTPHSPKPLPAYGTPAHAELQRIAGNLVRNEVHCCLSGIVSTLAKGEGLTGFMQGYLGELGSLCDQALELASPIDDWESPARIAGWTTRPATISAEGIASDPCVVRGTTPEDDEYRPGFKYAESWQDASESDSLEPYQRDVYEHWAVSQRLGEDLAELGEKVDFDFAGLVVWARTTTGQMIEMDHVMLQVAQLVSGRTAAILEGDAT